MLLVQSDFDDTITENNVSLLIRNAFIPELWPGMEREYQAGEYTVEQSNIRQFRLVKAPAGEIADVIERGTVVRPGFVEFAGYCERLGIKLVVVSSGLDIYVRPTLERLGLGHLETHSASARAADDGMAVEYADPAGDPITRGFKESYVRHYQALGHKVVYFGDGLSDRIAAEEADFVFARSGLKQYLKGRGTPHYSFENFTGLGHHFDDIRRQLA